MNRLVGQALGLVEPALAAGGVVQRQQAASEEGVIVEVRGLPRFCRFAGSGSECAAIDLRESASSSAGSRRAFAVTVAYAAVRRGPNPPRRNRRSSDRSTPGSRFCGSRNGCTRLSRTASSLGANRFDAIADGVLAAQKDKCLALEVRLALNAKRLPRECHLFGGIRQARYRDRLRTRR